MVSDGNGIYKYRYIISVFSRVSIIAIFPVTTIRVSFHKGVINWVRMN
ncbi:MAG TPA: hypothetical protein VIK89_15040 [Cytophagaceae bacterium]